MNGLNYHSYCGQKTKPSEVLIGWKYLAKPAFIM